MTGLRAKPALSAVVFAVALFAILSLAGPFATGQEAPAPVSSPGPGEPPAHESLTWQIEWRLISAGTAKLTWNPAPRGSTVPSDLRLHIESTGLVSRLFRVDDDYTATLGQNMCAQSTSLIAHEGSRNKETRVTYDTANHKAFYAEKDLTKNTAINREVDIPPCVHDVIGGLLVLRTLRLEPGKTVQIPLSDGKKFVQAKIESVRREDLNTALGPRKTIRYEVFLFDNVLYKRSGRLHVWLTDDNSRLPVQIQVRLQFTIGTITFKLEKEE